MRPSAAENEDRGLLLEKMVSDVTQGDRSLRSGLRRDALVARFELGEPQAGTADPPKQQRERILNPQRAGKRRTCNARAPSRSPIKASLVASASLTVRRTPPQLQRKALFLGV
jgi:hypothetical protein